MVERKAWYAQATAWRGYGEAVGQNGAFGMVCGVLTCVAEPELSCKAEMFAGEMRATKTLPTLTTACTASSPPHALRTAHTTSTYTAAFVFLAAETILNILPAADPSPAPSPSRVAASRATTPCNSTRLDAPGTPIISLQ